ncbi:hypothetical protein [Pseudomonas citronellolis]|uniref:hypothetical protein n=1 Tax=Pseudomonas citronellolis TaxID=53408 RepID=UPI000778A6F1|nr:hypothetical protein [Pseudomonas citronellolis]AMO78079.1 hypothetical protein PcP3B5_46870 [Pseudomonas citronellolis]
MTDTNKLKDLAERALGSSFNADAMSSPLGQFIAAANPQAILGLIERLERLQEAFDEANEMLARIGDFAHDKSTGPGVPDALWEVRSMAYSAVRIGFDAALEGGER